MTRTLVDARDASSHARADEARVALQAALQRQIVADAVTAIAKKEVSDAWSALYDAAVAVKRERRVQDRDLVRAAEAACGCEAIA